VTEAPTLLPPLPQDKRTKEVFALSLERMTVRTGRGFAPVMDRLDEGLSAQRMKQSERPDCYAPRNSACLESVFFLQARNRILSGLSRDTPKSPQLLVVEQLAPLLTDFR
jgi:hypothetical protein